MPFDGANLKPEQRVLLGAADLLEGSEWWRGEGAGALHGAYCAITALYAIYPSISLSGAYFLATERLKRFLGTNDVPEWNDKVAKSKEEVVAAMRAAAMWEMPNAI